MRKLIFTFESSLYTKETILTGIVKNALHKGRHKKFLKLKRVYQLQKINHMHKKIFGFVTNRFQSTNVLLLGPKESPYRIEVECNDTEANSIVSGVGVLF